jgi:hypothetical protein
MDIIIITIHRQCHRQELVGYCSPDVASGQRTAIHPIRDEIKDQTEAYDIPGLAMALLIHAQEILLKDGRVA